MLCICNNCTAGLSHVSGNPFYPVIALAEDDSPVMATTQRHCEVLSPLSLGHDWVLHYSWSRYRRTSPYLRTSPHFSAVPYHTTGFIPTVHQSLGSAPLRRDCNWHPPASLQLDPPVLSILLVISSGYNCAVSWPS